MIRDFCGITKGRLIDEIRTLRDYVGVNPEDVAAIDAVRNIGNIGAHMEKDISLIVDVEPGEAQALIELIELLFDEWYIARFNRQERLSRVMEIAAQKKTLIADSRQRASEQISVPAALPDQQDPISDEV